MGEFPGDQYPTESKDDRRAFYHHFAETAIDLGAQRDELYAVAEAALRTYEDLENLDLEFPHPLCLHLRQRKDYAVRAMARIKDDWPNAPK